MNLYKNSFMINFFLLFSIVIFTSEAKKRKSTGRYRRQVPNGSGSIAQQMCDTYTQQACNGNWSPRMKRAVGGEKANPKQYPHMALLIYQPYENTPKQGLCGGSLISENFVMSAAHCFFSPAGHPKWVILGELDLADWQTDEHALQYDITKIFIHPQYNSNGQNFLHDIALIRFEPSAEFGDYIRPICLNTLENIPYPNQMLGAAGWGDTKYQGSASPWLLHVILQLQPNEKCQSRYFAEWNAELQLCAGYAPGGKGVCQGDSGGPLLIFSNQASCERVPIYLQVGVVSSGAGCAWPDIPTMFTRVSYFIPWIESIVWNSN